MPPFRARPSRTSSAREPDGTAAATSCFGSTSPAGRVFRDRVADDGALVPVRTYEVPGTVGAIAPIDGDDGWLLAANRGFAHLSLDGTLLRPLADVAPDGTRMNDAACDPQGRFWAGTKAHDNRIGGGALYRLDRDGRIEQMLDGLTISNGLGWSPDGETMYLADTIPRVIHAFAFDGERGAISDGRVLIEVPEEVGAPDGLTVDADGDLWVAIWGGGRVRRHAPDGIAPRRAARAGRRDDVVRLRRPGPEPPVRHDRHRGLEPTEQRRSDPRGRARVSVRDRCGRAPGGAVPARLPRGGRTIASPSGGSRPGARRRPSAATASRAACPPRSGPRSRPSRARTPPAGHRSAGAVRTEEGLAGLGQPRHRRRSPLSRSAVRAA